MTKNAPRCIPKEHNGKQYYCSMELALMMVGGKWKPIILWLLGAQGTLRFGELRRLMPNVTQKMLTQQLRELEADGLVLRRAHPQVPPRVEYSLTGRGAGLVPILKELSAWAREIEAEKDATARPDEPAAPAPEGDGSACSGTVRLSRSGGARV
ncbi:winged helix-turn-helix transcriptional regulator [Fundidesulfovibrio terrae]|uniref:winged helix-turn-helix transcriptional regulator n=1 Tax=Fundidesulfovibrio terrae TaxID=2922866 RepID=UPI001FAFC23D|nr:helix-turn-helix domain-containing protein [Fundidesulfovibrio terrae]